MTYLGLVLDKLGSDSASVESRIKKYFAAVNSVVSRFGGEVVSDEVWMRILDVQLVPILT